METSGADNQSRKKKERNIINKIVNNGQTFTNAQGIANSMNQHFCEIGKKLQEQIRDTGDAYKRYQPQTVTQTFYLTPVTPEELSREIQKLNPPKAAGYDDIGPKVLKLCPDIFAANLTTIFNDAIVRAKYPTLLKVANVIALF